MAKLCLFKAFFTFSENPLSALRVKFSSVHPSRIYDFILTRCWAAHAVLCQAFSGNHSSKSFHNNENKNTFPPELSIFASEARRHGGRVKIIYHTPATFRSLCLLNNGAACAWPTFQCGFHIRCEGLEMVFFYSVLESVYFYWILESTLYHINLNSNLLNHFCQAQRRSLGLTIKSHGPPTPPTHPTYNF